MEKYLLRINIVVVDFRWCDQNFESIAEELCEEINTRVLFNTYFRISPPLPVKTAVFMAHSHFVP